MEYIYKNITKKYVTIEKNSKIIKVPPDGIISASPIEMELYKNFFICLGDEFYYKNKDNVKNFLDIKKNIENKKEINNNFKKEENKINTLLQQENKNTNIKIECENTINFINDFDLNQEIYVVIKNFPCFNNDKIINLIEKEDKINFLIDFKNIILLFEFNQNSEEFTKVYNTKDISYSLSKNNEIKIYNNSFFNLMKEEKKEKLFFYIDYENIDNILFLKYLKKYFLTNKISKRNFFLKNTDLNYIKKLAYENRNINKNVTFSFVTLVNNKNIYINELENLKNQMYFNNVEFIVIPNFNNEFSSCAEALNYGINLSDGKYIILCHQDLLFPNKSWLLKIEHIIKHFEINNINWGVLGIAGINVKKNEKNENFIVHTFYLVDKNTNLPFEKTVETQSFFSEVQTLDELCLIIKNDKTLYFDEQLLYHYHFYGADICLLALSQNKKNFAVAAECIHLSDGTGNLISKSQYEHFCECARRIAKKWSQQFETIVTTTSIINSKENKIFLNIYDIINSRIKQDEKFNTLISF